MILSENVSIIVPKQKTIEIKKYDIVPSYIDMIRLVPKSIIIDKKQVSTDSYFPTEIFINNLRMEKWKLKKVTFRVIKCNKQNNHMWSFSVDCSKISYLTIFDTKLKGYYYQYIS